MLISSNREINQKSTQLCFVLVTFAFPKELRGEAVYRDPIPLKINVFHHSDVVPISTTEPVLELRPVT